MRPVLATIFTLAVALTACAKPPAQTAREPEPDTSQKDLETTGEPPGTGGGGGGGGEKQPDATRAPQNEGKGMPDPMPPPKPEMARWDRSKSCVETCARLAECDLSSQTPKACAVSCEDADEDEVTMATYTCFAEAHDCNDMAGCDAP